VTHIYLTIRPADEPVMHAELLQLIHDTISFSVKTEQLYFTNQLFSGAVWFGLIWFGVFVHPFSHICNTSITDYNLEHNL